MNDGEQFNKNQKGISWFNSFCVWMGNNKSRDNLRENKRKKSTHTSAAFDLLFVSLSPLSPIPIISYPPA